MRARERAQNQIDWFTLGLFLLLVFTGWINIYSASYEPGVSTWFDLNSRSGKQLLWIGFSIFLAFIIMIIDARFFPTFAYPLYILLMLSLVAVLVFGKTVAGARSWFQFGSFAIQPSEFAKFATALAVAKFLSGRHFTFRNRKKFIQAFALILLPAMLVLLQNDTGSALVYLSFSLVFYREGLAGGLVYFAVLVVVLFVLTLLAGKLYVIYGLIAISVFVLLLIRRKRKNVFRLIGVLFVSVILVLSVDFAFENILEPHQKKRINVLLGKEIDLQGAGYNVNQSKIAIGSGGLVGKGFLHGTQTKFDFVPEQSTDFIFCTVGEEWGYLGASFLVFLFFSLLVRLIILAERQRSVFARVYGYGVASVLFFHVAVNMGMTMGLFPVIGIPLPFISYGGSSLWAFTILLFIFIKQDANRLNVL